MNNKESLKEEIESLGKHKAIIIATAIMVAITATILMFFSLIPLYIHAPVIFAMWVVCIKTSREGK